jgi:hypothetical protein
VRSYVIHIALYTRSHIRFQLCLVVAPSFSSNANNDNDCDNCMSVLKLQVQPSHVRDCEATFFISMRSDASILELKEEVAKHCNLAAEEQKLIWRGQLLRDEATVQYYGMVSFDPRLQQFGYLSLVRRWRPQYDAQVACCWMVQYSLAARFTLCAAAAEVFTTQI